jgi:type II secretory pathway pseudopilin PulG
MGLGQGERGYAMAALLVGLSIMAILMTMALPNWIHLVKREKEEELIWRGQQYARAIGLFQRKYANTFPPNVEVLVEQRFLRKKYKDPITNDEFLPIPAAATMPGQRPGFTPDPNANPGKMGPQQQPPPQQQNQQPSPFPPMQPGAAVMDGGAQGRPGASIGIQGVVSKSPDESIKVYNGRTRYNEWAFVYMAAAQRIGPGGQQMGPGGQQLAPGSQGQSPPGMKPGQQPFGPMNPPAQPPPQFRPPGAGGGGFQRPPDR